MKLLVLGDIHGRGIWQYIIEKENPDKVIFVGDYFDSFDIPYLDQMYNFKQIIHYKKQNPNKYVLLIGNHDFHYILNDTNETYSGYQSQHALDINQEIKLNIDLFQMVHKEGNFLFSHAGVTKTWLENCEISNDENMVDLINDFFKFKPNVFRFGIFRTRMYCDSYGDDIYQSPIWVRPRSLMKDSKDLGYIQIVGHTQQNQIDIKGKSTGGKYFFIDTLGTSGEYLIIEDGQIKNGKI